MDPLNAFCPGPPVHRPGAGAGALAGLTFAVKDVFDLDGLVTGAGSPEWARTHPPADSDADAVRRLLEAGATLVGRTICDELAFSLTGENPHYGTPANPRAPGRVPGGSSSGSASAVAGGACDFALGTDTAGSIRIPASYCGLYGMRPSHGAIDAAGTVPLAPSYDAVGWFARDAETLSRVGEVLLPPASSAPILRAFVAEDAFMVAGSEVCRCLEPRIREIRALAQIERGVILAPNGLPHWAASFRQLQAREVWKTHGAWVTDTRPDLEPAIRARFQFAAGIPDEAHAGALVHAQAAAARLSELIEPGTVLCVPAAAGIAPLRNSSAEIVEDARTRTIALTAIAGLGGLPQICVPAAELRGCPLGLSFIGARGADRELLAFASRVAEIVVSRA